MDGILMQFTHLEFSRFRNTSYLSQSIKIPRSKPYFYHVFIQKKIMSIFKLMKHQKIPWYINTLIRFQYVSEIMLDFSYLHHLRPHLVIHLFIAFAKRMLSISHAVTLRAVSDHFYYYFNNLKKVLVVIHIFCGLSRCSYLKQWYFSEQDFSFYLILFKFACFYCKKNSLFQIVLYIFLETTTTKKEFTMLHI